MQALPYESYTMDLEANIGLWGSDLYFEEFFDVFYKFLHGGNFFTHMTDVKTS